MTVEEASGHLNADVWPDNLETVNVFVAMGTQWRYAGLNGAPTGLEYSSLEAVMRLQGVPRTRWPDVFEGVRVMEASGLQTMHQMAASRSNG